MRSERIADGPWRRQKWPWLRLPGLTRSRRSVLGGGQEALKKTLWIEEAVQRRSCVPGIGIHMDFDQKRALSPVID